MRTSDYAGATGGALKLKGSSIDKTTKKKKKKTTTTTTTLAKASAEPEPSSTTAGPEATTISQPGTPGRALSPETAARYLQAAGDGGGAARRKTEAERRHDEKRRKRLEERMKKEGVKTHKEKVEELNKYLSGLSEHHDMPKIGPG